MTQPHLVDEATCTPDGWDGFRWKTLLSADRTPTAQITQGIVEIMPAPPNPLHVHCHAQAESYYVLSGEGMVWIGDDKFSLSPGTVAFIPGGAHHTTFATGTEPLRILYTFAADSFSDVIYEFPALSADGSG